jgi:hypothetical protein
MGGYEPVDLSSTWTYRLSDCRNDSAQISSLDVFSYNEVDGRNGLLLIR